MAATTTISLQARVRARLAALGAGAGSRLLIAVSGGGDSVALTHLIGSDPQRTGPRPVLAVIDHGWQHPVAAAEDQTLVTALAEALGLACVAADPPTAPVRKTEDEARRFRYRMLEQLARTHGCTHVVTAHHLGDQAETVLMRLLRGSGLVGLAGMPPRRRLGRSGVWIVRPLLEEAPESLTAWREAHDLVHREDPANLDTRHERVRARQRIARFAARGDDPRLRLSRLATRLQARLAWHEQRIENALRDQTHRVPSAPVLSVERSALRRIPPEFLPIALRWLGTRIDADHDGPWFTRRHIARIANLLESGGSLDLPRGLRIKVAPRRAWLGDRLPGRFALPALTVQHEATGRPSSPAHDADRPTAWLRRALEGEFRLRRLAADDRFVPSDTRSGRARRVHAWLARRGVPAWVRAHHLVVTDPAGQLVWLVGSRVDQRACWRAGAATVLQIENPGTSVCEREAARADQADDVGG